MNYMNFACVIQNNQNEGKRTFASLFFSVSHDTRAHNWDYRQVLTIEHTTNIARNNSSRTHRVRAI